MKTPSLKRGLFAGFVASITLILLGLLVSELGAPFLDWTKALAIYAGGNSLLGYALSLSVGLLLAVLFVEFLHDRLPGTSWNRGLFFSVLLWIVTGLLFAPLMHRGFFMESVLVSLTTLILYLAYGAILGFLYDV